MRVRIEIDSGDGILTKRQNAELDDMLAVVLGNSHLPAVSSFDHLGGVRGDSHIAGYFVEIPDRTSLDETQFARDYRAQYKADLLAMVAK